MNNIPLPEDLISTLGNFSGEKEIIHIPENYREIPEEKKIVNSIPISDSDNGILFIRSSREGREWELPGGRVNKNEKIERGLRREVYEETGRYVTEFEELGADILVFPSDFIIRFNYITSVSNKKKAPCTETVESSFFTSFPEKMSFEPIEKPVVKKALKKRDNIQFSTNR